MGTTPGITSGSSTRALPATRRYWLMAARALSPLPPGRSRRYRPDHTLRVGRHLGRPATWHRRRGDARHLAGRPADGPVCPGRRGRPPYRGQGLSGVVLQVMAGIAASTGLAVRVGERRDHLVAGSATGQERLQLRRLVGPPDGGQLHRERRQPGQARPRGQLRRRAPVVHRPSRRPRIPRVHYGQPGCGDSVRPRCGCKSPSPPAG